VGANTTNSSWSWSDDDDDDDDDDDVPFLKAHHQKCESVGTSWQQEEELSEWRLNLNRPSDFERILNLTHPLISSVAGHGSSGACA
jgi:hypothetical protein